jgi:hypothetical protein
MSEPNCYRFAAPALRVIDRLEIDTRLFAPAQAGQLCNVASAAYLLPDQTVLADRDPAINNLALLRSLLEMGASQAQPKAI